MTVLQNITDTYKELLILQYNNKPMALATMDLLIKQSLADLLPLSVLNAFDLDTATGVQLDLLGSYAGITRRYLLGSTASFLNDDDFRSLIKLAIIVNTSFSSLYKIQSVLFTFFKTDILLFDFKNMRLSYFVDSSIGSIDLIISAIQNNLLPKPMGVQLASVIYALNIDSFFGYVSYEIPTQINASPYNTYEDYELDRPFLRYEDAIF